MGLRSINDSFIIIIIIIIIIIVDLCILSMYIAVIA